MMRASNCSCRRPHQTAFSSAIRGPALEWRQHLRHRYSKEEFDQLGQTDFERDFRPHIREGDQGKFVPIDTKNGAYEI